MTSGVVYIHVDELLPLVRRVLQGAGCAAHVADILADNCVRAEQDGSTSHGLFRLDGYISTLASGWVDGHAVPVIEDKAPAFLCVDAANGFTQVALALARDAFVARTRENGVAILAIRNSHHLAALWPDVESFAQEGLIALSMINSFKCAVPYGAHDPVFGTNPLAMAAPGADGAVVVFDMATTTMSNGDVQVARREGRMLPHDTGVDAQGNLTGDPTAILDGGNLVPFGGYKGSAIALMVEMLCAGLGGGNFSFEFDWSSHPGAHTPHTGQLFIGIDPSKGGGAPFGIRMQTLSAALRDAGLDHLPGERRHAVRAERAKTGIPISQDTLARLRALAQPRG